MSETINNYHYFSVINKNNTKLYKIPVSNTITGNEAENKAKSIFLKNFMPLSDDIEYNIFVQIMYDLNTEIQYLGNITIEELVNKN